MMSFDWATANKMRPFWSVQNPITTPNYASYNYTPWNTNTPWGQVSSSLPQLGNAPQATSALGNAPPASNAFTLPMLLSNGAGGSTQVGGNVGGNVGVSTLGNAPPTTQQPQWGATPPGVDSNWWNAFAQQHNGQTPVDYYAPTSGGNPNVALGQALRDRDWGQQFYNTYGRAPSEYDWQAHWYGGGGSAEATQPSWWGEQIFGDGVVQWPGMEQSIDLKQVRFLDQIPTRYQSWFQDVMGKARSNWPNPLIPPILPTVPKSNQPSSNI